MSENKSITCCVKCKRLKTPESNWVKIDKDVVTIISDTLCNGFCDICADEIYDELQLSESAL